MYYFHENLAMMSCWGWVMAVHVCAKVLLNMIKFCLIDLLIIIQKLPENLLSINALFQ